MSAEENPNSTNDRETWKFLGFDLDKPIHSCTSDFDFNLDTLTASLRCNKRDAESYLDLAHQLIVTAQVAGPDKMVKFEIQLTILVASLRQVYTPYKDEGETRYSEKPEWVFEGWWLEENFDPARPPDVICFVEHDLIGGHLQFITQPPTL